MSPVNPSSWTSKDVVSWLKGSDLSEFCEIFEKIRVDGFSLLAATDSDLQEMGISLGIQRKKIMGKVAQLREAQAGASCSHIAHEPDMGCGASSC